MFPHASYEELALPLEPGDTVLFFSDGIVDAVDAEGEQFGQERLCALVQNLATESAGGTLQRILTAVTEHQAGTEHFDDETLIVLQAT